MNRQYKLGLNSSSLYGRHCTYDGEALWALTKDAMRFTPRMQGLWQHHGTLRKAVKRRPHPRQSDWVLRSWES